MHRETDLGRKEVLRIPDPTLGLTGQRPVRSSHQNMLGYLEGRHPKVHALTS